MSDSPPPTPVQQPVINVQPSPVPVTVQPSDTNVICRDSHEMIETSRWLGIAFVCWAVLDLLLRVCKPGCCKRD